MTSRVAARLATSVVIFCLCAELAALAAYYVETGGLFYTSRRTYQDLFPAPESRRLVTQALHPYFGPTHTPGTPVDIPEALRVSGSTPARLNTNEFWIRLAVRLSLREATQRPVCHRDVWQLGRRLVLSGGCASPAGGVDAASVLPKQRGDPALFQSRGLQAAAGSSRARVFPVYRTAST